MIRQAYQDLSGSYHEYVRARGDTHVHTITKVVTLPLIMAVTQITRMTKPRSDLDQRFVSLMNTE